eukprot:TRINITY_DN2161_c0_g1_i2.p1 TRINITY_DN2161_c0_g1~~TRINITY_DN2161_c0_g1_i2.p1  ORF type:complete len:264 (-),score=16.87 TRINITY_DN2161_c0_g1_i2:305-1096(-)
MMMNFRAVLFLSSFSVCKALSWSDFTNVVENIGPSVGCGIGIAVGLVFAFFGYRLFKFTLFLCGFIVSGGATYFVLTAYVDLENQYIWFVSLGAGIVGGIVLLFLWTIGIFLLGALLGFALVALAMSVRNGGLIPIPWVRYAVYAGVPFFGGVLAVAKEKIFISVATSLAASFSVIACVDYFAGNVGGGFYELVPYIIQGQTDQIRADPVTYAEIAACLVLAVFSCGVQLFFTGRKHDHRDGHGPFCSIGRHRERYSYDMINN